MFPQIATNISLSKFQLIYEGRQCSLQTARHYVPGTDRSQVTRMFAVSVGKHALIGLCELMHPLSNQHFLEILIHYSTGDLLCYWTKLTNLLNVQLCRFVRTYDCLEGNSSFRICGILNADAIILSETSSDTRRPLSLYLMP